MKTILANSKIIVCIIGLTLLHLCSGYVHAEEDTWTVIDDSEERNGEIRSSRSDMHYVYYEDDDQYAGFRFEGVNIPAGRTIISATLRFDKRDRENRDNITVQVYGELSPNPSSFGWSDYDISSRTLTSSSVRWDAEDDLGTPDLKNVIQEIIDQPGWSTYQTIVLITRSNQESRDQRIRVRSEEQDRERDRPKLTIVWEDAPQATIMPDQDSLGPTCFEGYDAASASFVLAETSGNVDFVGTVSASADWISFTIPNGGFTSTYPLRAGTSAIVGVHYDTTRLLAGTYSETITIEGNATNSPRTISVTLLVKDVPASAACGQIPLYAENLINPAIMVQLDTSGSMDTQMPILADGRNPRTPSLVDIIQEIVDRPALEDTDPDGPADGWVAGNDMAFVITGTGQRRAYSYDGQTVGAPKLVVEYSLGGTSYDVEYHITSSGSDVQEDNYDRWPYGSYLKTNEDYIELGRPGDPVGLIFENVDIPFGATIESAEIQFVIHTGDRDDTDLVIYGIDKDSAPPFTSVDQLTEDYTTASVAWNDVERWDNTMSRIAIAEDVLKEVFLDRSISWGFATWAGGNCSSWDSDDSPDYYTRYRLGIHDHDDTHQDELQDRADDGYASGCTPLAPTMKAAYEYFTENRRDEYYREYFADYDCQPRIVVLVTDGIGNTATTLALVEERANELLAEGISVVAVGFGIDESEAGQLYRIAELAQAAGKATEDDFVYPLHKEDANGTGVPYLAQSREDFINAMVSITSSVKAQAFHGSAPAATTSADNGELLLSSTFDASDWTGDVTATKFDYNTAALEATPLWTAKDAMPVTINGYIYDKATSSVSEYTDASLPTDNFMCKPLGDIINSTPKIVGKPAYWYRYDAYSAFKYNPEVFNRDALTYVAANDGALHAINLDTGVEKWRFYPDAVKTKLNLMGVDPTKNMCSPSYCHQFIFDGSPQAADIFNGSDWKTILVTGLGKGGSAFVGLDVTYGNDFGTAASADEADTPSSVLWEFNDSDLGLATAFPEIERVVKVDPHFNPTGSTWATFFGSGESELAFLQPSKEAYLFGIDSWDASPLWLDAASGSINKVKLAPVTLLDDVAGPPLAIDLSDSALNNRIYITNMYGNMYRVADIGDGQRPYVDTFFYSGKTDHSSPAIAKPAFAYHADPDHDGLFDIWLYFGTGIYQDQVDKVSSDQQYFYGLYDVEGSSENPSNPENAAYVSTGLEEFTTTIVEGYAVDDNGDPVDLNGDGSVTPEDMRRYRTLSCTNPVEGVCNPLNQSWRLALDSGSPSERSINKPLVVAGIVIFATFIPDGDPCEGSGEAWLFAVDYETGGFVSDAVFDINNDGSFTNADKVVKVGDGVVGIAGIFIGQGRPNDPVVYGDVVIPSTTVTPPKTIKFNLREGRARVKAWRQLFN